MMVFRGKDSKKNNNFQTFSLLFSRQGMEKGRRADLIWFVDSVLERILKQNKANGLNELF